MADAVQRCIPCLAEAEKALKELAPGGSKKISELVTYHKRRLLAPENLLANLLHQRYRGQLVSEDTRRLVLAKIPQICAKLSEVSEFCSFLEKSGRFADVDSFAAVQPQQFWSAVYKYSSLSKLGEIMTSLSSSQASLERVFSCSGWLAEGRERLSSEHLFEETFVRYNRRVLL